MDRGIQDHGTSAVGDIKPWDQMGREFNVRRACPFLPVSDRVTGRLVTAPSI